jgi:hypothetical protein
MFLMRANPLRGPVRGGWALEIESFLGPVKWHRADRRVPFGAQKLKNSKNVGPHLIYLSQLELLLHLPITTSGRGCISRSSSFLL